MKIAFQMLACNIQMKPNRKIKSIHEYLDKKFGTTAEVVVEPYKIHCIKTSNSVMTTQSGIAIYMNILTRRVNGNTIILSHPGP